MVAACLDVKRFDSYEGPRILSSFQRRSSPTVRTFFRRTIVEALNKDPGRVEGMKFLFARGVLELESNWASFVICLLFGAIHRFTSCKTRKAYTLHMRICKEARPHRPSSEYLTDSARKSPRCLQETTFHCARVPTSIRMPTCAPSYSSKLYAQKTLCSKFS